MLRKRSLKKALAGIALAGLIGGCAALEYIPPLRWEDAVAQYEANCSGNQVLVQAVAARKPGTESEAKPIIPVLGCVYIDHIQVVEGTPNHAG